MGPSTLRRDFGLGIEWGRIWKQTTDFARVKLKLYLLYQTQLYVLCSEMSFPTCVLFM